MINCAFTLCTTNVFGYFPNVIASLNLWNITYQIDLCYTFICDTFKSHQPQLELFQLQDIHAANRHIPKYCKTFDSPKYLLIFFPYYLTRFLEFSSNLHENYPKFLSTILSDLQEDNEDVILFLKNSETFVFNIWNAFIDCEKHLGRKSLDQSLFEIKQNLINRVRWQEKYE